ncbi:extracellular solute-binding protein [Salinispira pacifica]
MKFLARVTIVLTVLTLASGLAFAAGQKEAASAPKKTTITWWALSQGGGGADPREALRKQIIADYQTSHPNVDINLVMLENEAFKQKVQVAVQAGNPPDIFHSWGGGVMVAYAKAGMLRDITSYVEKNIAPKIGKGPLSVYGYDGHYYGAPYDMGAVGMWYNKAIFQKAGVTVPETWDQLLSAVQRLKSAGYIPIALGAGDKWPAHFWWTYLAMRLGGEPAFKAAYDGSGSFADPTFVKAGQLLLQLRDLDPFQTGYLGATYDDEAALIGNGKAAMELMGQWAPGVQASDSSSGKGIGDDLGWFSFPAVAGGVGKNSDVLGGGNGYVIGKNAPDEALDFLNFFLSPKYDADLVKVEGVVPVVQGAESAIQGNANLEKIVNAVSKAGYFQLYYDQFLPPAVGETVKDAVVAMLAGKATPAQGAQMVQDSWKKEQGK